MSDAEPAVTVVIVTRNRASRLAAALRALRAQTLPRSAFEVVVVDDGSTDATPKVLSAEAAEDVLDLRPVRRSEAGGAALARNDGWQAARGRLVAFTDDDCTPLPGWLEAGLSAWDENPERFVQGMTTPAPDEMDAMGPFSYSYDLRWLAHEAPTCNIFYPGALLERLGGFDVDAFIGWGEDTDLAWRARALGAEPVYEEQAHVHHAVVTVGPAVFLRRCWSQGDAVWLLARHPALRRARLHYRVFWNPWQAWLLMLLVALALPGRRWAWPLKVWLARPYLKARLPHPRHHRASLGALLWFMLADAVEMAGSIRGGVRYRTFVL